MRPRGVALLVVLWLLVLLVGTVGLFVLRAQAEALQASGARLQLQLAQAAEGGVEAAVAGLLRVDAQARLVPDGRPYALALDGLQVEVRITDEAGKVDVNVADVGLLARLLEAVGEPRAVAQPLAAAIVDWRDGDIAVTPGGAEAREYRAAGLPYGPANQPFARVSELQRVLGMGHARLQRLRPYVTVHSGQALPQPVYAPEPVLRAMGLDVAQISALLASRGAGPPDPRSPVRPGEPVLAAGGSGTYSVSSRATRTDGPQAHVEATVRVGAGGFLGQVYTPLLWLHDSRD